MKRIVFCIFVLFMVVGCANTDANLRRETARIIGGNFTPDQVTVSNVDRGMTNVDWTAVTPDGTTYKCSSDDMLRRPNCVKK
jgi:hypothetical protein